MWRLAVLTEFGRIPDRSMLNAFIPRQQNVGRRSPQQCDPTRLTDTDASAFSFDLAPARANEHTDRIGFLIANVRCVTSLNAKQAGLRGRSSTQAELERA